MTEVEALRERVRMLEASLGLPEDTLPNRFALPPALQKILGLLMSLPTVTAEMIEERLGIATPAKVAVFRLRRKLKPYGIEIQSKYAVGYWLDPDTKEKVSALITAESNTPSELSA